MIEQDLVNHLTTDVDLLALVSARIYPNVMPQDPVLPALVYTRVDGVPVNSVRGRSGLKNYRMQIDCYARTYAQLVTVHEALLGAMNTDATAFEALPIQDSGFYEEEPNLHRIRSDFSLWAHESETGGCVTRAYIQAAKPCAPEGCNVFWIQPVTTDCGTRYKFKLVHG